MNDPDFSWSVEMKIFSEASRKAVPNLSFGVLPLVDSNWSPAQQKYFFYHACTGVDTCASYSSSCTFNSHIGTLRLVSSLVHLHTTFSLSVDTNACENVLLSRVKVCKVHALGQTCMQAIAIAMLFMQLCSCALNDLNLCLYSTAKLQLTNVVKQSTYVVDSFEWVWKVLVLGTWPGQLHAITLLTDFACLLDAVVVWKTEWRIASLLLQSCFWSCC